MNTAGRQHEEELREIAADMRRALLTHGSLGTVEQSQVGLAIGAVRSWILAAEHGFTVWKHEDVGDVVYQARLTSALAALESAEPLEGEPLSRLREWLAGYHANNAILRMQALAESWNWLPERRSDLDRPGWGALRKVANSLKHRGDDILRNSHRDCNLEWAVERMREVALELGEGRPWGEKKPPKKKPDPCPNCGYVRKKSKKK